MQGDINKAAFKKFPPSPPENPRMHTLDSHLISKFFSTTAALKDLCVTCMNWFFALATQQGAVQYWLMMTYRLPRYSRFLSSAASTSFLLPKDTTASPELRPPRFFRKRTFWHLASTWNKKKCGKNNGKYSWLVGYGCPCTLKIKGFQNRVGSLL